jgi:ribosomal protein S27E
VLCYNEKEGARMKFKWMKCPKCGNEHFIKVSRETRIYKFPAYCKKCKNEIVITVEPRAEAVNS